MRIDRNGQHGVETFFVREMKRGTQSAQRAEARFRTVGKDLRFREAPRGITLAYHDLRDALVQRLDGMGEQALAVQQRIALVRSEPPTASPGEHGAK
jgi:hypothetical protein